MSPQHEPLLCRYHYDPLDRLIGCTLLDEPEFQRFYCKKRLATEIQGTIKNSIFQHDDQLLAQQRHGDKFDATLLITDCQRSVLHTLGEISQRQSIAYSPYGHRPIERGITSSLGFNGERADPVTGHYLLGNGYRAFNPVLMRFNSPDRLSPFGKGGLNQYVYCLGDPVNRVDPTGSIPFPALTKIYLGQGFWTKKGVSGSIGKRMYSRFQKINMEIEDLTIDLQRDVFAADKLALSERGKIPDASIRLDQLAYEALRHKGHPLHASIGLQRHAPTIKRASINDKAKYHELFRYLDKLPDGMKFTQALYHGVEGKGLDPKVVASYRSRLQSIASEKIYNLRNESRQLYENYFES